MATLDEVFRLAEAHSCFSGCYAPGNRLHCLVDVAAPPEPAVDALCEDCLSFRVGGLISQLGSGMTQYQLARDITHHMRVQRGYTLSFGGYHTQGGGFWLSAAYWHPSGVFLLKSDRGASQASSDIDLLVRAFQNGVAQPLEPNMLDASQYRSQRVFLNMVGLHGPMSAAALLGSSHVSQTRKRGYVEVTVAEYLPVAGRPMLPARAPSPSPAPKALAAPAAPRRRLALGERCEVCGEVVAERPLLTSVYVGCACG